MVALEVIVGGLMVLGVAALIIGFTWGVWWLWGKWTRI